MSTLKKCLSVVVVVDDVSAHSVFFQLVIWFTLVMFCVAN